MSEWCQCTYITIEKASHSMKLLWRDRKVSEPGSTFDWLAKSLWSIFRIATVQKWQEHKTSRRHKGSYCTSRDCMSVGLLVTLLSWRIKNKGVQDDGYLATLQGKWRNKTVGTGFWYGQHLEVLCVFFKWKHVSHGKDKCCWQCKCKCKSCEETKIIIRKALDWYSHNQQSP
jgi:hypothetical protein